MLLCPVIVLNPLHKLAHFLMSLTLCEKLQMYNFRGFILTQNAHIFQSMKLISLLSSSVFAQTKIIGGFTPTPGSEPYVVSIKKDSSHYCGGALISNSKLSRI